MIDPHGLPLSTATAGANVAEVHIVETLTETSINQRLPERLIYDKASCADWLRTYLARNQIELICPHRSSRKKPPIQDGRSLRRDRKRLKVERTISWLQNCRRLVTRYEYHECLFVGLAQLACLFVILKGF